jgi:hypothetical protein
VRVRAAATKPGLTQKGKHAISAVLSIPKVMEKEADAIWQSHEAFMNATHLVGSESAADDIGHPRMMEFYVSKGDEMKDPMNPGASTILP